MSLFVPLGVRIPQDGNPCLKAMYPSISELRLPLCRQRASTKQKSDRAKSGLFDGGRVQKSGKDDSKSTSELRCCTKTLFKQSRLPCLLGKKQGKLRVFVCFKTAVEKKKPREKLKSTNAPYFPSYASCFYEKEKRTKLGKLPKTTLFRRSGSTG